MTVSVIATVEDFVREIGAECTPPGEYSEVNVADTVGYSEVGDNPPDHRERPSQLIGSPTSLPLQWHYQESHVVNASPVKSKVAICNEGNEPVESPWYQEFRHYNSGNPRYPCDTGEPGSWRNALLSKVSDLKMDLGEYLAEGQETVTMFTDLAKGLKGAYDCVRRRRRPSCQKLKRQLFGNGSIRQGTRKAAEIVLYTDFGLIPPISDVGEGLARLQSRASQPVYHRVIVTMRNQGKYHRQFTNLQPGNRFGAWINYEWDWEVSDRAVAWLEMMPGYSEDFSPGNPLSVVYAGTPFSFVLDWMIPVGDYLVNLTALRGINVLECTVTRKHKVDGKDLSVNEGWALHKPGRWSYRDHMRNVVNQDDITPELPSFQPTDSWRSLVDAAALLRTLREDLLYESKLSIGGLR